MKTFSDIAALVAEPALKAATDYRPQILARLAELTKPPGSLGKLEELVVWLGSHQQTAHPSADKLGVLIFVGNHGTASRTSIFPPEVTMQMVDNFNNGGAVINQLARAVGAKIEVKLMNHGKSTADFTKTAAMDEGECVAAIQGGFAAVENSPHELICLGEMGIGNTAAAVALAAALFGGDGGQWVGNGAGTTPPSLAKKTATIDAALARHRTAELSPLEALRRLGGFEIAALVGAIIAAARKRKVIILDGITVTAAAAVVARLNNGLGSSGLESSGLEHCLAGHCSAERSHRRLLNILGKPPLLDLKMRLGEGSGALLAAAIVKSAVEVYNCTSTFAEARVADGKR